MFKPSQYTENSENPQTDRTTDRLVRYHDRKPNASRSTNKPNDDSAINSNRNPQNHSKINNSVYSSNHPNPSLDIIIKSDIDEFEQFYKKYNRQNSEFIQPYRTDDALEEMAN